MKKKVAEQLAERRLKQIESLEGLLSARRKTIERLQADCQGYKEIIRMLETILFKSVAENGRLVVKKDEIADEIRAGYKIRIEEDLFVIEKVE